MHAKHHKLASDATATRLASDLNRRDVEHMKADVWRAISELKELAKVTAAAIVAGVEADHAARLERLAHKDDLNTTTKILKWVLGVVTVVGTGSTVALISMIIKTALDPF